MINEKVIVKKSEIHGLGVFARVKFKEGDVVLDWDISDILLINQVQDLPDADKSYITLLTDGKYVLLKSPERYVNHSCYANTNQIGSADVAIRRINEGEEITADYRKQDKPDFYMECNCGNNNCDKLIES